MKIRNYMMLVCATVALGCLSCANSKKTSAAEGETTEKAVQVPAFNADSAYLYVKQQVDFGPRTPNSRAHDLCGDYLAARLESFGAKVYNQRADLTGYDGKTLKARNIIGAFNPDAKRRVLLCAHWDTRPWADNDPDEANHHKPILGANDGASGVGVLLEVARQLQQQAPAIGVDIIFFDMEDSGTPQFASSMGDDSHTWCLGSQYWARAPHVQGYNARFGILLDTEELLPLRLIDQDTITSGYRIDKHYVRDIQQAFGVVYDLVGRKPGHVVDIILVRKPLGAEESRVHHA